MQDTGIPLWPEKIRIIPKGQPLIAPDINKAVTNQVYEALLLDRKIRINYQARGKHESTTMEINPLGLVFRGEIIYLVCTIWKYPDIRTIVLHRIVDAEAIPTKCNKPLNFSLDEYIDKGGIGYRNSDQPAKLTILIDENVRMTLEESPLSLNQKITVKRDKRIILEATVIDTVSLRSWLLSYGECIEVLKPKHLRDFIKETVKNMADKYLT